MPADHHGRGAGFWLPRGWCSTGKSESHTGLQLKDLVDDQVNERDYGTSSEYVRELIWREKDRLKLRGLLLEGATSASTTPADNAYYDRLAELSQACCVFRFDLLRPLQWARADFHEVGVIGLQAEELLPALDG
jgi:antitoxin ParD1/3/4